MLLPMPMPMPPLLLLPHVLRNGHNTKTVATV
jgi:hypothetical protein